VVALFWDLRKQVIASLSISGPNFRLTEERLEIYIRAVLYRTKEISEKLGFVE